MSENTESITATTDDPSVPEDDSVRTMPDLEAWMNEIEEFVAEISNDLNAIGQSLGDRTLASGTRSVKADSPTSTIDVGSSAPVDDNDRLGSLKRRLANLKAEPTATNVEDSPASEPAKTWETEANVDEK